MLNPKIKNIFEKYATPSLGLFYLGNTRIFSPKRNVQKQYRVASLRVKAGMGQVSTNTGAVGSMSSMEHINDANPKPSTDWT